MATALAPLERRWREPLPSSAGRSAENIRRRRKSALTVSMLALAGTILGFCSWLRPAPRPALVPCFITEFRTHLVPVNAAAGRDLDGLADGRLFVRKPVGAVPSLTRRQLLQQLSSLSLLDPCDSVVLYLSAKAGSFETGISLFAADSDPDDPRSLIPLRDVLDYLRACPAGNQLLVLDVAWLVADPRLGLLSNDVAAQVPAELAAVPDQRRWVLCPCSPGQTSLISEDLGRSLFGYYFEQGLLGTADGCNPTRECDGRVTVSELSAFVSARVDRWAIGNRRLRQTPQCLAQGDDFELTAVPRGRPQPEMPLVQRQVYPDWLAAGWQMRERWWNERNYELVPRIFRHLEALLLGAEQQWRWSVDSTTIARELKSQLADLERQLEAARQRVPRPEPKSLAMLAAGGFKPDPAVGDALNDLLAKLSTQPAGQKPEEAQAARAKLIDAFQKKIKDKPTRELAWAVFQQARADAQPTPERLRLLDSLLKSEEPQPVFVETQCLRRMCELADTTAASSWAADLVRAAIEIVDLGERAVSQPRPIPWVLGPLSEAAQHRHNAEVVLSALSYAPRSAAEQELQLAASTYAAVLAVEEVLSESLHTRDEALSVLAVYPSYLEQDARNAERWTSTVRAACELAEKLRTADSNTIKSVAEMRSVSEDLRQVTATVRSGLEDLRTPFRSDNVARLIQRCSQAQAGPCLHEARALLITPFLSAADRARLWQAAHELSHRLASDTWQLDTLDDQNGRSTPPSDPFLPLYDERREERMAAHRAAWSIELLRLAGLNRELIEKLERLAGSQPTNSVSSSSLPTAIRLAWSRELPRQIEKATVLTDRDRLCRVVPPYNAAAFFDDPHAEYGVLLESERANCLLGWLADHDRYEARDGASPEFYASAANEVLQLVSVPAETYAEIDAPRQPWHVSPAAPRTELALPWRLIAPAGSRPAVTCTLLSPDPSLQLSLSGTPLIAGQPLSLSLHQLPQNELQDTLPKGFLVRLSVDGRAYHRRIDLPSLAETENVEVWLSTDARTGLPRLDELHANPAAGRQPYFVFLRNPSHKSRDVVVQLTGVTAAPVKISLGPRQSQRVEFAGNLPAATTALPEIQGPLVVRVFEADQATLVCERRYEVRIPAPRELLQVTRVEFDPGEEKNRLSVSLRATPSNLGTPCPVELVVTADDVPGLMGISGGTFRGELPADGKELTLFAEGLRLAEGADRDGSFNLTVAGCPRAVVFDATFTHYGSSTAPRESTQTRVGLCADRLRLAGPDFKVGIEVDNPPDATTIELSLGHGSGNAFTADTVRRLPAARHKRVGCSVGGPQGGLLVDALVEDWAVPFDATGIIGPRTLRAVLRASEGDEVASAEQQVVFDNSPPEIGEFVNLPSQASREVPLSIQATGQDALSGIARVTLFVGRPVDGKLPPGAATITAQPSTADPSLWTASLIWPASVKGPTEISVQFVNGVGLSTFATSTIDVSPDPAPAAARILGKVMEGPRPQADLEVTLTDAGGAQKAKLKTDSDGRFVFEGLTPGKYKVSTEKPVTRRKGEKSVSLEKDETARVTVELFL